MKDDNAEEPFLEKGLENPEAFMRGVRERLSGEADKVLQPLMASHFWEFVSAVFSQIAVTPYLKDQLQQYEPPPTAHEVETTTADSHPSR